jgi:hypothetical protein
LVKLVRLVLRELFSASIRREPTRRTFSCLQHTYLLLTSVMTRFLARHRQ